MAQQDAGQTAYDDITGPFKKANDWMTGLADKITGKVQQKTPHQKAVDEMNKQENDKTVQDATKSFQHPVVTAAQKKIAPAPNGKTQTSKPAPRKKM